MKTFGSTELCEERTVENKMESIKNLLYGERIEKLSFDGLNDGETLVIETRNSTYRFLVIDAISGQGILMGGAFDDSPVSGLLIGVSIEDRNGFRLDTTCLKIGGRAIFHLDTEIGIERLITSRITNLFHVRDSKAWKRIA